MQGDEFPANDILGNPPLDNFNNRGHCHYKYYKGNGKGELRMIRSRDGYRTFVIGKLLKRLLLVVILLGVASYLYLNWEIVYIFVINNIYYLLAFSIGAIVGIGELLDRYRDAFHRVLLPPPAITYVFINGVASCAALGLMVALGLTIEGTNPDGTAIVSFPDVLIAGFGALAFFRSSFFTTTVGNQSVGIGPNAVLQTLLNATDRQVDRHRANERFYRISHIMSEVSYESIVSNLLPFAFSAREHLELSTEDRQKVTTEVNQINKDEELNPDAKKIMIALTVEKLVGIEVLQTMISSIVEGEERARYEEEQREYEERWSIQREELLHRGGPTPQPPTESPIEEEDATLEPSQRQNPGESTRS